jgi:hypothetical protein
MNICFTTGEYWIGAAQNHLVNTGAYRTHFIRIDRGNCKLGTIRFVSVAGQPYYATHGSQGRNYRSWQEAKQFALTGK